MMKADIINVGNELLFGLTVNTNAAYIGKKLAEVGIAVNQISVVGDDSEAIQQSLGAAIERSKLVVLTGGLGTTHDDITSRCVSDALNTIETDTRWEAAPIPNSIGSAEGILFSSGDTRVLLLPGVPVEMECMLDRFLMRYMHSEQGPVLRHRLFKTAGIRESDLAEKVGDVSSYGDTVSIAFLPESEGVSIRLSCRGNPGFVERELERAALLLEKKIGNWVYAREDENLVEIVAALLLKHNKTIAVAESCTGGLIAHLLTNVPGSSAYFPGGAVVYSNHAKRKMLNVPESMIQKHGAVSRPVAQKLAEEIRRTGHADYGLATTGIAGPAGGTAKKPVGLVYIGLADPMYTIVKKGVFGKDRQLNKEKFAFAALNLLRKSLDSL